MNKKTKRNTKIVVHASKQEVEALIGNHGAFSECAGFDQELVKVNQWDLDKGFKFHFSKGVGKNLYLALQDVMNSSRYPRKEGKEFESIRAFKDKLAYEYRRQAGCDIGT